MIASPSLPTPALECRARIFKRLWSQEIDSKEWIPPAYECSLPGRYDNRIPPQFLAPIDCLKIPAQDKIQTLGGADAWAELCGAAALV